MVLIRGSPSGYSSVGSLVLGDASAYIRSTLASASCASIRLSRATEQRSARVELTVVQVPPETL